LSAQQDISVWSALRQIYARLSPQRRQAFYGVVLLLLLGAFAELVSIAAILPFLSLLADPERMQQLPVLPEIFAALGAETRQEQLFAATGLFAATAIIAAAIRLQLAWTSQGFVFRVGHEIGVDIQRRILNQPYSYHIAHNSSEIVSSLEKVQVLVFAVLLQLMIAATSLVIAAFIIATLVYIDPFVAAVSALSFGLIYAMVSLLTRRRVRAASATIGATYAKRVQMIQESLGGIRDIIIDHSQSVYLNEYQQLDARFTRAKAWTAFIGTAPRFVVESLGMITLAVIALVIADREGGLAAALPVLGAVALGAQRLLPLVQQVYQGWSAWAANRHVTGDVLYLLDLPVSQEQADGGRASPLPFREQIRIEDVTFFYPGRDEPALHHVSLVIPRGSRVALIGQTGSGKSTLTDLLMGLLEPSSGRICIDGEPLTGQARRGWQRSIAHVPQSIFLADTSIARNIAFGVPAGEIDQDRVVLAARKAQLHEVIEALPQGYQTMIGERGVRLSGGQRQRLGIARAVYKAAPVLVLDEATSALDDATEAAVTRALQDLSDSGLTIIMVAHRLSTIAECDIVVRLDKGRVSVVGSYAEVVGGTPRKTMSN
jgi:ATP-binding cassette, subfamily B, bacterial PglK